MESKILFGVAAIFVLLNMKRKKQKIVSSFIFLNDIICIYKIKYYTYEKDSEVFIDKLIKQIIEDKELEDANSYNAYLEIESAMLKHDIFLINYDILFFDVKTNSKFNFITL